MGIIQNDSGAVFSACRRWRYLLWRCWDRSGPVANFLMLNPSTADEAKLDPTCSRARAYAEAWGYGALIVTNIFGWRSTDPRALRRVRDPVGAANDAAILRAAGEADLVVCAWGNHGIERGREVEELLRQTETKLHILKLTGAGHPGHPLYLRKSLKAASW
ncbi:MAG TPA: DUF1643 domain-containing protein [Burkholderiales bacterium]|nr:DUF1643 domain-containing protein [Burkholderiales bacterium]